jgi:hypothetical protein
MYMTFLLFSLRLARVDKKDSNRWDEEIKNVISKIILSKNDNPLLFFVLGQFLPNIHFLDESWMVENFNRIFPLNDTTNWSAALTGYLYFHQRPNKIYFKLLLENGHLKKAILSDSISGDVLNSLTQQICIAYLNDFDGSGLKDDIFQTLINSKKEKIYSSIIYFFWSPRFPFEDKLISKIKPLWLDIFSKSIKLENYDIDSYILSGCCQWINSINTIDGEIFELMLHSVKFINERDRYSVIESLAKHINNSPEYVGNILVELFKCEVSYDISRGKIHEMVEILFEKGMTSLSNQICLLHAEKGFHFLRDLFIKYNV